MSCYSSEGRSPRRGRWAYWFRLWYRLENRRDEPPRRCAERTGVIVSSQDPCERQLGIFPAMLHRQVGPDGSRRPSLGCAAQRRSTDGRRPAQIRSARGDTDNLSGPLRFGLDAPEDNFLILHGGCRKLSSPILPQRSESPPCPTDISVATWTRRQTSAHPDASNRPFSGDFVRAEGPRGARSARERRRVRAKRLASAPVSVFLFSQAPHAPCMSGFKTSSLKMPPASFLAQCARGTGPRGTGLLPGRLP